MKVIHRDIPDFAEPPVAESANGGRLTIADRWDALRYGPVGRVLGYCGTFIAVFALIFLVLWCIETNALRNWFG